MRFIDKIKANFSQQSFFGIEAYEDKGMSLFSYVELIKVNDELELKSHKGGISFEELISLIPRRTQVGIVLNGNYVLTKSVQEKKKGDEQYINAAFPNTDLGAFYYEIYKGRPTNYISICRQNKLKSIVADFEKYQLPVTTMSLGNTIASILIDINLDHKVSSTNAKIDTSGNNFEIEKGTVVPENYDFEGVKLDSSEVLSFCSALNMYFQSFGSRNNFRPILEGQNRYLSQLQYNYYMPRLSLGLIFLALVINTILYFDYTEKVEPLQVYDISFKSRLLELDELEQEVTRLENITDKIGNQSAEQTIFYVNEILKHIPLEIVLSEFLYQPVSKSIKKGEDLELVENEIQIKGDTSTNESLSKWLLQLEQLEWIEDIIITDFKNDGKEGQFEISLKLKRS